MHKKLKNSLVDVRKLFLCVNWCTPEPFPQWDKFKCSDQKNTALKHIGQTLNSYNSLITEM